MNNFSSICCSSKALNFLVSKIRHFPPTAVEHLLSLTVGKNSCKAHQEYAHWFCYHAVRLLFIQPWAFSIQLRFPPVATNNKNNNLYFIKNWYIIMKIYNLSMKTKTQIPKNILNSSLDWTNQILDIKAHKSFSKHS